ncbi:hypothetical protein [Endozoicomonas atrinae]|nr:hypothetical protein [Endozoicomonas atrinae]
MPPFITKIGQKKTVTRHLIRFAERVCEVVIYGYAFGMAASVWMNSGGVV